MPQEAGKPKTVEIPTAPKVARLPRGATVSMVGGAVVDFAILAGLAVDFIAALGDAEAKRVGVRAEQLPRFRQDQRFAANVVVAAVKAMTEVKPRLKARSMTRTKKRAGSEKRIRVHGMSRVPRKWKASLKARVLKGVQDRVADALKSAQEFLDSGNGS